MGTNRVKEVTVVRYHQHRVFKVGKVMFKPAYSFGGRLRYRPAALLQAYLPVAILVEYLKKPDASLDSLDSIKVGAYVNPKLSERMAAYDLDLLASKGRHINSGPAFVTKINIGKVDQYSGSYR